MGQSRDASKEAGRTSRPGRLRWGERATFDDPVTQARADLIRRILQILFGLFVFMLVLAFFQPDAGPVDTAIVYSALFSVLGVTHLTLHRARRVGAAAFVLSGFLFLVVSVVVLTFGGLDSQAASAFVPVMLIAGLTIDGRAGIAFGVAAAAFCGLVAWLESAGNLPTPFRQQGAIDHWVNFLGTLIPVAILVRLSTRHLEEAAEKARHNELAHRRSLDELRQTQETVERRARQSAVIGTLGQELLEARTRTELADLTAQVIAASIGDVGAVILERERGGKSLRAIACTHRDVDAGGEAPFRTEAGELLALLDGTTTSVAAHDGAFTELPLGHGASWVVTAPIPGRAEAQGLLCVGVRGAKPTEADVLYVTTAAGVLGSAMERDEADRRLRHSQRLEAVGQLAGGIAHDFNNLLTAILTCTQLAMRRVPDDSAALPLLRDIESSSERAALLTQQLLTFSRRAETPEGAAHLPSVLDGLESILGRLLGEHIQISVRLDPDLPEVAVDQSHLEQVLLNLCVNARDAMPSGGEIRIAGRLVDPAHLPGGLGLADASYVALTVEDDGEGIPEELRDRIFEPFFSTKEHGRGTGLGLSTVFGICRGAGGAVQVESELGVGSTFTVFLPVRAGRRLPAPLEPVGHDLGRASGTLLVVEDNPLVRRSAVSLLEGEGYAVASATNGLEAMRLLLEGPLPDLVLTDLRMPRMGGLELAQQIERRALPVRLLFMSGYAADAESLPEPVRTQLVRKPFRAQALLQAVAEALRRQPALDAARPPPP